MYTSHLSNSKTVFPEQIKKYSRISHVDFVFLSILEDMAVKRSQINYNIGKILSVAQSPESTLNVIIILKSLSDLQRGLSWDLGEAYIV